MSISNEPKVSVLVGLWQNGASAVTRPDKVLAATEYWWRRWLPLLGWKRWFLVTNLRWLYSQNTNLEGTQVKANVTRVEIQVRDLAAQLGMGERELYSLLDSEPIDEGDGSSWRQLALPSKDKRRQDSSEPRRQVELLRLFIPRLRYRYVREDGKTRRQGFVLELTMDDLPTPEDAVKLEKSVNDVIGIHTQGVNDVIGIHTRGVNDVIGIHGGVNDVIGTLHTYLHEHDHDPSTTHLPPHRQPTDLSVRALRNQYPQQPDGLDPNYVFNLALDRAIGLLPPKLRKRAEQSLYVLAAELHPAALERPSRRWPDAGGAGWVVDAVVEAGDRIQSLEYVNKICTRWMAEGNPYAIVPEPLDDGGDEGFASTFEQAIAATWAAAGGTELSNGDLELLAGLLGPGPERTDLGSLLANIVELGRRVERMTPELVEAVVTGRMGMPPLRDTRFPDGGDSGPPPVAQTQKLPDDDPVLAQVIRWFNQEISYRVTPMVADDLRDLTVRQRNLDVWEYAVLASKYITNTKGRWSWVTAVVLQPDMNKIDAWLAAGKPPIRPDARAKTRRSPRSKRAPVVTCAEMPDPPEELMEEPALPPPN